MRAVDEAKVPNDAVAMQLLAPAKINLHLRVFGARNDGFHPLLSWMTTVGLFDSIEIHEASGGIALTCDDPTLPCDASNLVYRAAELLLSRQRSELNGSAEPAVLSREPAPQNRITGVQIHLAKRIPSGGGLGGGSSDAARTLLGLNRLLKLNLSADRLAMLASQLGSDVPFFLSGPSSVCQGRGEIVQPIAIARARWATLILPAVAMPTPAVYRTFDSLGLGKAQAGIAEERDQPPWQEWTSLKSDELLPRLINDLESPAFTIAPHLGRWRSDFEQTLGRIVRMSGSGSTLFTLFDNPIDATRAAETIERTGTRAIAVKLGVSPTDEVFENPDADQNR